MDVPPSAADIFADALERQGPAREVLIRDRCGGDKRLRAEVESLLRIADEDPALVEFPNKDADDEPVPANIGRYRVLERCGTGGMGIVYRAEDPSLRRTVAIKVLQSRRAIAIADTSRLQAEALMLASLNHPNVATIYSLESDGNVPYLVMEFVRGRTLAQMLRDGPVSASTLERTCMGMAAGLGAAHARGIIHRDLKPANVMIADDGSVKLLDFGIAKDLSGRTGGTPADQRAAVRTGPHTIGLGTPAYMSPEQRMGKAADRRSDIWGFGMVLRECLAGGPTGLSRRTRTALEQLSQRCLNDSPDERPEAMETVTQDLACAFATPPLRRGLAPIALGALVIAGVLGIAAGVRWLRDLKSIPVAATHTEQGVEVTYSDGARRLLIPPPGMTVPIDSALIASKADGARIVLAWARDGAKRGGSILFWSKRGRLLATFPTTSESPFTEGGPINARMYGEKQIADVSLQPNATGTIDVIELAHYFPCALRRFAWDGSSVRESYRLYHAGNINRLAYSPGVDPGSEWPWLSGRIRDGGALRRAAEGIEANSHFLACFDASTKGTEVYPDLDSATTRLGRGTPGEARFARPILYFVVRGFVADQDRIDWITTRPVMIVGAMSGDDGGIAVLLSNTVRFDIASAGQESLAVAVSLGSMGQHVMQDRARRSGLPADEVTTAFLADSVVILADADEHRTVTGRFRDIRPALATLRTRASP